MVVTLAIRAEQRTGRNNDRKLPVWSYLENFETMSCCYYRPAEGGVYRWLDGWALSKGLPNNCNRQTLIQRTLTVAKNYKPYCCCAHHKGVRTASGPPRALTASLYPFTLLFFSDEG